MKIKELVAVSVEGTDVKGIGEVVVIDEVKYEIKEVNSYYNDYDKIHNLTYSLEKVVEVQEEEPQPPVEEPKMEDLQKL